MSLVSSSEMLAMSAQQYGEFLKENPPSKDAKGTEQVRRVGKRIQTAVETYMRDHGDKHNVYHDKHDHNIDNHNFNQYNNDYYFNDNDNNQYNHHNHPSAWADTDKGV